MWKLMLTLHVLYDIRRGIDMPFKAFEEGLFDRRWENCPSDMHSEGGRNRDSIQEGLT
jgi:hypothetical protein